MSKKSAVFPDYKVSKICELVPPKKNARRHSSEQIDKIAMSIREFGFVAPIVVGAGGVIVAGAGRFAAAKMIGLSEVPTISVESLTESQCRALAIAENKIHDESHFDDVILASELAAISDGLFSGFDDEEIEAILGKKEEYKEKKEDIRQMRGRSFYLIEIDVNEIDEDFLRAISELSIKATVHASTN